MKGLFQCPPGVITDANLSPCKAEALLITLFRIQYSVIQFFLNPYMDKGFENPEERDCLFCNEIFIIILYYIYLYI